MSPRKSFPIETIEELLFEGYNITQLANHFQTSRQTMSKFLKANSLVTNKEKQLIKCKEVSSQYISKLYLEGKTIKEISILLGVSNTVVKDRLKVANCKTRTNSEAHKKYFEDFQYFDSINTCDKAYLLGFICADGWVSCRNELGISLALKDKEMVYWFKNQLKTDKPVIEKENCATLIIQNEKITHQLNQYNIIPNKSLTLDIKTVIDKANISKELIPAFLLGYFDGDGGVYKTITKKGYVQYSCSITGTYETCLYFKEYFDNIGFLTKRHQDDKNNYTYQIGGRNQVKKGLSKLYQIRDKLSFYYERKYNIYCEL